MKDHEQKIDLAKQIVEESKRTLPAFLSPEILVSYGIKPPDNANEIMEKLNNDMVDFMVKTYSVEQLEKKLSELKAKAAPNQK